MQTIPLFLNLGGGEVFLIFFVVLLLFGGKGLPSLAKALGKGLREFKDATNGLQKDLTDGASSIRHEVNKETSVFEEKIQEVKKDIEKN